MYAIRSYYGSVDGGSRDEQRFELIQNKLLEYNADAIFIETELPVSSNIWIFRSILTPTSEPPEWAKFHLKKDVNPADIDPLNLLWSTYFGAYFV